MQQNGNNCATKYNCKIVIFKRVVNLVLGTQQKLDKACLMILSILIFPPIAFCWPIVWDKLMKNEKRRNYYLQEKIHY